MSKCIILGAGASYGYDERLSEFQRPPLTNQIFSRGLKLNLLDRKDFPNLLDKLQSYSKLVVKTRSTDTGDEIDVENFLSWMAERFETLEKLSSQIPFTEQERLKENMAETSEYKTAIGELWYFLFEIIRHYSVSYKPSFNAYQRLALHSHDRFYNVISLNYDTIFESAIVVSGLSYSYSPPNGPAIIPIAKVHGSVNWLNPIGRAIANPGLSEPSEILKFASRHLHANRLNMDAPRVLDLGSLSRLKLRDLFRSGADYDEPILIPPIGNHKDYEKVNLYQQIWNFATRMLSEATELVIIGTTLRKEDTRLAELLKNNLGQSTKIVAVGNKSKIVQGFESMTNRKLSEPIEHFPDFIDYAKSL